MLLPWSMRAFVAVRYEVHEHRLHMTAWVVHDHTNSVVGMSINYLNVHACVGATLTLATQWAMYRAFILDLCVAFPAKSVSLKVKVVIECYLTYS